MYWTGKTLESTKKQPEALKLYEVLMKNYPASPVMPRVYLALGNIYYDLEKWDESIRNYRLIVDDPDADKSLLPIAMSNLIETYETAGVFDAALQLTRKYLELYPNNEDSFDKKIKIGVLYQRLGYNEQSVLHLQTLLDQAGSDLEGEIRYYIAEANYNKGDFQQAILDFLKVPYLVTKKGKMDWTANSLYMAGQSYEKLGRFDQALTMYQQILGRSGIDETFKAAAKKEIERVKLVVKKPGSK
jgi:tetratricopeptide (TPR) repeat protein